MPEQEYVTKYKFENSKGELNHKPQILLHVEEEGEADSYDVVDLLYCSVTYASTLLNDLWRNGFLKRTRKKIKRQGRPSYIYELTEKGERVCNLLHKKGY